MSKPHDQDQDLPEGGATGGSPEVMVVRRAPSLSERWADWRQRYLARLQQADLAPDLALDIGSLRWFRGLGTLFALIALALLLWPDFTAVEAASPAYARDEVRDEFRSRMILPLALGADSGRRMAPDARVVPLKSAPERPSIELVASLGPGDSFHRMLQRAGLGGAEADQVAGLVNDALPLSQISPGTRVDMVLGRRPAPGQPRPLDKLSFRARFDLELALERRDGQLVLDPRTIRVDNTPLRIRGRVGASLYRSARAAGAPASAVQQYLQAISEQSDLESALAPGDEFDLIIDYRRAATGEVESGNLIFAGVLRDGAPRLQLMRWGNEGRFYEASGVGEQRSGLLSPVPGAITSRYGMRRHPILGYTRMHAGLDFKAGYGQPIYAVTDGRVVYAGRHGGHGNYVKLDHGGGLATGYAHMSRIAVDPGERVRRGQVIGYVGSTGLSTGAHLHYEMYRGGRTVDPASVKFVNRAELTGGELQRFRARLAALQQVAPGAALTPLAPTPAEEAPPLREIDRLDPTATVR